MARKKKTEEVINNKIWIGDWEFEEIKKDITIYKPIRDKEGSVLYANLFRYLLKVMPQDHRDFDIVASLLTYINYQGSLTDKQVHLTNRILDYWKLKGIYDV